MDESKTIQFEKMPGISNPVKMTFIRRDNTIFSIIDCQNDKYKGWATPDIFSWDMGMRYAVKNAVGKRHIIYRNFRRWQYLKSMASDNEFCVIRNLYVQKNEQGQETIIIGIFPSVLLSFEFGQVKEQP